MRRTAIFTVLAVLLTATALTAGDTSFSAGVGGWFVWEQGEHGLAMSSIPLGIRYTPDIITNESDLTSLRAAYVPTPGVSRLSFSVQHVVRDGAADVSLIGGSYALWQFLSAGVEICPEVSAVIKYVGSDRALLGFCGGIRVPFTIGGPDQMYEIRLSGFYDGESPGAQIGLVFLTG